MNGQFIADALLDFRILSEDAVAHDLDGIYPSLFEVTCFEYLAIGSFAN